MKITSGLFAAWAMCVVGVTLAASDSAPLGSPDFFPSPEHPVGWRGDGTGRFPGATPPAVWNRRLKDITSEIVVQAGKPKGKPGPDSHVLEYFTVKDWLVAGPFPADPEKDIDKDFLGGEADIQPDAGDKAGDSQWMVYRAYEGSQSYRNHNEHTNTHLYVDFVYAFGKVVPAEAEDPGRLKYALRYTNLDRQAAYAHTYLYAPREADVRVVVMHGLPAIKMWVNGAAQGLEKGDARNSSTVNIHLKEGWNRLLVKALCDKSQMPWGSKYASPSGVLGQTQWRFATYIKSTSPGPFSHETKNIAWMIKLTGRNCSQPITVGDKLFVGSGDTDLFCLEKKSGKILWMHTGTYWDAMTAEERAAVKDKAEPLLKELDKANSDLVALLNENISPNGLDSSQQTSIDKKLEERSKLATSVHNALSTGQKGKLYLNEVSAGNAAPASDGQRVYWVVQGNGGYLTLAFDLDGKLLWSNLEFQPKGAGEHGSHRSPLLCDGKLIVTTNEKLLAYDAATGKERWQCSGTSHQHGTDGQPNVVTCNGRRALQTTSCLYSLDGEILSKYGYTTWGCYVPVVENGVLYNCCNRRDSYTFEAFAIAKEKKSDANWRLDARTLYGSLVDTTLFFYVASPLYVDGLLYQVDESGILLTIDTQKKKLANLHWMDSYNYCDRGLYGYCASPTLAGKNIYLLDDAGYTTIIKPGAEFTLVRNNNLQNITNLPRSVPGKQETFYAGMWFDGKQMFVHGDEYLYCIEEKE